MEGGTACACTAQLLHAWHLAVCAYVPCRTTLLPENGGRSRSCPVPSSCDLPNSSHCSTAAPRLSRPCPAAPALSPCPTTACALPPCPTGPPAGKPKRLSSADVAELIEDTVGASSFERDHPLIRGLKRGIGIHHGGLPKAYRQVVEVLFRAGHLRVGGHYLVGGSLVGWPIGISERWMGGWVGACAGGCAMTAGPPSLLAAPCC